jgi:hypothetical protein
MKSLSLLTLTAATAVGCDNPFGYSYSAETVKQGHYEFEQYVTAGLGRDLGAGYDGGYRGYALKSEFEYGLSANEQIEIEVNQLFLHTADRNGLRFDGVNVEYRRMLADPDKADWGRAFTLELGYSQADAGSGDLRSRYAFEAKYIFQHNFGENSPWLYVANLSGEVTYTPKVSESAFELRLSQGIAYQLDKHWSAGLECVAITEWADFNDFEESGVLAGPMLNYRKDKFSASLTALAQVTGAPANRGRLNVSEYSPLEVRLVASWEF